MTTAKLLLWVRNTFYNKSYNDASALASSPSSTEHVVLESKGAQNTVQKVRILALVGIVPNHVFFVWSSSQLSHLCWWEVERVWCRTFRICDSAMKLRFTNACKSWSQIWLVLALVLIDQLSRDAARAYLRNRRAPGLGRNHLSCKREYLPLECAPTAGNKTRNAAFSWTLLGKFVFWSTVSHFHVNVDSNALKRKRGSPGGGGGGGGGGRRITLT